VAISLETRTPGPAQTPEQKKEDVPVTILWVVIKSKEEGPRGREAATATAAQRQRFTIACLGQHTFSKEEANELIIGENGLWALASGPIT
jgi:hypothetical protein